MNIVVYSATWCGPCIMLKSAFKKAGLSYTPVDIDADLTKSEQAGIRGVPTIVITDDDGKELRIIGFNEVSWKRIKEVIHSGVAV